MVKIPWPMLRNFFIILIYVISWFLIKVYATLITINLGIHLTHRYMKEIQFGCRSFYIFSKPHVFSLRCFYLKWRIKKYKANRNRYHNLLISSWCSCILWKFPLYIFLKGVMAEIDFQQQIIMSLFWLERDLLLFFNVREETNQPYWNIQGSNVYFFSSQQEAQTAEGNYKRWKSRENKAKTPKHKEIFVRLEKHIEYFNN